MSTTTSNTAGEYDEKSQTVAPDNATTYLDDQIVMIDGKEIVKKIDSQPRIPQVTFRIQPKTNRNPAPIHYAKMFLPKTHEDAKQAAYDCFGSLLEDVEPLITTKRTLKKFELKVLIRTRDPEAQGPGWAWAYVRPQDWWKIMNELIEENPDVQVGVFV